jgi:hypothetical protein
MDFAVFPFKPGYYDFSPSGALLDALGYEVPVIAIKNATILKIFEKYGPLGILCDHEDELLGIINRILEGRADLGSDTLDNSFNEMKLSRSVNNLAKIYLAFPSVPLLCGPPQTLKFHIQIIKKKFYHIEEL